MGGVSPACVGGAPARSEPGLGVELPGLGQVGQRAEGGAARAQHLHPRRVAPPAAAPAHDYNCRECRGDAVFAVCSVVVLPSSDAAATGITRPQYFSPDTELFFLL